MRKFLLILSVIMLFSTSGYAMTTSEFDDGMAKGIDYFDQGLYAEAQCEFQWFCDYNWGKMNPGQQQYALDYLGSAKIENEKKKSQSLINGLYNGLRYKISDYWLKSNKGSAIQYDSDAGWIYLDCGHRMYGYSLSDISSSMREGFDFTNWATVDDEYYTSVFDGSVLAYRINFSGFSDNGTPFVGSYVYFIYNDDLYLVGCIDFVNGSISAFDDFERIIGTSNR